MRIEIKDKKQFTNMFNKLYKNIQINNINGLTIDSRMVQKNDIYLPIIGTNYDGHEFINTSLESGAIIAFSEKKSHKPNIINTTSVKSEIYTLCSQWYKLSKSKVIGITGSNGKTTTKNLIHLIMSKKYQCSKTYGNFNSTIGLPLSYLSTSLNDEFCILEYGASRPNEIKKLCKIVQPHYSFITNISNAHIENYKSINEIYKTKIALYEQTHDNGICFINRDEVTIIKNQIKSKIVEFSIKNKANTDNKIKINVPNHLSYFKKTIQSIYIICKTLNIDDKIIDNTLQSFDLPKGRGNIIKYENYNIIDDSYNANPKSVEFAINRFNKMKNKGKKIFIFADMLELGNKKNEEHKAISRLINKSNIDIILTYGKLSKCTYKNIKKTILSKHYNDIEKLKIELNNIVSKNDFVYLKGSRSMKLERIYKRQ